MPDNVLSTPNVPGDFLPPDDRPVGQHPVVAYELGGIALNDTSQGLQYQVWVFEITNFVHLVGGDGVSARPEAGGSPTVLYTGTGITEVSGAFDANMNPTIAFVENGLAKLRWWDASDSSYKITTLQGAANPRLTLDDKREAAGSSRDILLFYLLGSEFTEKTFAHRRQRDRYAVEYVLATNLTRAVGLGRVGMGTHWRMQMELLELGIPALPPPAEPGNPIVPPPQVDPPDPTQPPCAPVWCP